MKTLNNSDSDEEQNEKSFECPTLIDQKGNLFTPRPRRVGQQQTHCDIFSWEFWKYWKQTRVH